MDRSTSKFIALALVIISLVMLYVIREANSIGVSPRIVAAIVMLVAVGYIISKLMGFKSIGAGFYMLGGKSGIKTIDSISKKNDVFWDVMAMWGLTLGFGLLTYPLVKGKIDKRVYAFGILSLILIMLFVLPYLSTSLQFISIPQVQNAISSGSLQPAPTPLNYAISYAVYGATVIAGFSGYLFIALFIGAEKILFSIVQFISNPMIGASGVANQIGVAPAIPGITLPFIAGLISLAILLIIHEFSHGILARKFKVRLKEVGILMFGSVPVGGYVEPDENQVSKLNSQKQTRIFSAGVSANFIAMVIFFIPVFLLTVYIMPHIFQYNVVVASTIPNYPANGILKAGMVLLKWNNYSISNQSNLTVLQNTLALARKTDKINSTVILVTNQGTYSFKAIPNPSNMSVGIIGVSFGYQPVTVTPFAKLIYFFYTLFALSLLLNFAVGALNLLPIPGFDGWRIYSVNIKSERFTKFFGALVIILLIVNVIPLILYLV